MSHHSLSLCPGCGSGKLSEPLLIPDQPVILNYRFMSTEESAGVPLRTIAVAECERCGLVFNAALEEGIVPYDHRYENRQSHSEAFAKHTAQVAKMIGAVIDRDTPHLLEVGCGKGEFLRKMVDYCSGSGEGWDTSYEGSDQDGAVTFHRDYLSPEKVHGQFDAVICRHVVEHVAAIGKFLEELVAIAREGGSSHIFIETPRLEWILENKSAWDIFYEHCNYFTEASLACLCRKAGFKVLGQFPVFAMQYQFLVLSLDNILSIPGYESPSRPFDCINHLREIQSYSMQRLSDLISNARNEAPWAIWGAGAKGVCLANRLPSAGLVQVIDTNTAKQGFYIPGTHIPIVAPSHDSIKHLGLIVIANPTYEREIQNMLNTFNYAGGVLVLTENLL